MRTYEWEWHENVHNIPKKHVPFFIYFLGCWIYNEKNMLFDTGKEDQKQYKWFHTYVWKFDDKEIA